MTTTQNNKYLGFLLLVIPLLFLILYFYILFFTIYDILILKLTILIVVGILVTIFSWMGFTMITSKPSQDDL